MSARKHTTFGSLRGGLAFGVLSLTACLNEPPPEAGVAEAPEALTAAQNVKDFLLEDVCLDQAGNATSEDPWTCPERRRNRRMSDPITYLRRTPNPFAGARGNAYPTQGPAGEFRVAFAHELGKRGWFDKSLGEGTDVLEASGVVSSVNTEDSGGGGNTPFRRYWSQGCVNDGWAYFPTRIFNGEKSGTSRTSVGVGETCTGHYQSGWYTWKYEPSLDFGSASGVSKALATIVSRQGPDDPDRPSYFEEVHFTSLYGVTRWSAWRREDPSTDTDENARKCALPRKATVAGREFVPTACNNLVQIDPLPPSEWRSSFSWPINEAVSGSRNTLHNGDFSADGLPGWNGVAARVDDANANMFGACGASCFTQNGLSVSDARGRDKLMFGARLWTAGNADQVTVTASVHRNGTWVVVGSQLASLSGAPSLVTATAPAAQNGDKIRITFAAANAATELRVDDAYASFTFPQLY